MSKILLVDDDVDLAELVKAKLATEGHQTSIINTGEGAFELAKQVKPDITILDIMLPGITGYQICRRIRKDPELYKTAVLILTALGEEPEILHGLEQGADDYLVKPFKLERLVEKLTSLESLLESVEKRNSITNLPGTEAIKREINHRLARGTAIAACYLDVVGFKPYCASRKPDAQVNILRFITRLLATHTRNMGIYECYISHLGGEHFVLLFNIEDYDRFCTTLLDTFDHAIQQFYTPQEISQGFVLALDKRGAEIRCPIMALSIGVTHTQFRQFKSAKKMFEVLAQVRQMAQPDGKSVLFVDRRRSDR